MKLADAFRYEMQRLATYSSVTPVRVGSIPTRASNLIINQLQILRDLKRSKL